MLLAATVGITPSNAARSAEAELPRAHQPNDAISAASQPEIVVTAGDAGGHLIAGEDQDAGAGINTLAANQGERFLFGAENGTLDQDWLSSGLSPEPEFEAAVGVDLAHRRAARGEDIQQGEPRSLQ